MDFDRRTCLCGLISAGFVGATSGCLSGIDPRSDGIGEDNQEQTTDLHAFGETVEYRGVEVVPNGWTTADEIRYHFQSNERTAISPSNGSTFLLTHIEIAFIGTESGCCPGATERLLPARANANGKSEDISVIVNSMPATIGPYEATAVELGIDNHRLTPYEASRRSKDAHNPVRPGIEFAGWTVSELSNEFDPKSARIEIQWGAVDSSDHDQIESTVWQYDDTRLVIEDAATLDGTIDS